jgi:TusA-related sulfurtransferase
VSSDTNPGGAMDGGASAPETSAAPVADLEVDASGLACPLPILRAKKALAQLASGQVLKVTTTDRNAIRDFQAFARQTGNALLLQDENAGRGIHYLRRR